MRVDLLPLTDLALRKLWLLSLGLNVESTRLPKMRKLRVCSVHFSEDDYLPAGQRMRRVLKSSAVPAPQVNKIVPNIFYSIRA